MSNDWKNVIYIGMTNNLVRRVYEHKAEVVSGFTSRYHVKNLVYYEQTTDVSAALAREKQLKGWNRSKKNRLINLMNPSWKDLYSEISE